MRSRWFMLALALSVTVSAAGCGIAHETDVRVDGPPRRTSLSGSVDYPAASPPSRTDATNPTDFVKNYLKAAAGDAEGAYARVRSFLASSAVKNLPAKPPVEVALTLVRLDEQIEEEDDRARAITRVTVPLQVVGTLKPDGTVTPAPANSPSTYVFEVGRVQSDQQNRPQAGFFLFNPPNTLMLSTEALGLYYERHTVYFWSTDNSTLVPDQRLMPNSVPTERRATEVAHWLNEGPSERLASIADALPRTIQVTGNVAETAGRMEINLAPPSAPLAGDDPALDRFATQLAWSLPDGTGMVDLKVRNETLKSFDAKAQREVAPLYGLSGREQRFAVYGGQVGAFTTNGISPVPIVPDRNKDVLRVGMRRSGDNIAVALVKAAGGRQRLYAGIGRGRVDPVNASRSYTAMSRPVWLKSADPDHPAGLVTADGRLYRFDVTGIMVEVKLPDTPGSVTAVGAALDGRRIAVIAGGRLYVVALNTDNGGFTVGAVFPVPTALTTLTAVDWIDEEELAVAGTGRGNRPTIVQLSTDGSSETPRGDQPEAPVDQLATYPGNPVVPYPVNQVMYEANGVVYADQQTTYVPVTPAMLGLAGGDNQGSPRAPVFLY